MHHQHLGRCRRDDDRVEILHRVVGHLGVEAGIDPDRRAADQQRIAVRRRTRRKTGADIAANSRRWWHNSAMALNMALPNALFKRLGVPQLAG